MERRLYESTSVYKIEKENKSNKKEIQNEHKIKKIIKINGKPKKKTILQKPPKKTKESNDNNNNNNQNKWKKEKEGK